MASSRTKTARGRTSAASTNPNLTPHQVKTILDHNEGIKSGDVTRAHYMFLTGENEKWPIMTEYCDWVDKWGAWKD